MVNDLKEQKHTRVVTLVRKQGKLFKKKWDQVFPVSKNQAIKQLKSSINVGHKFFQDLHKNNKASFRDQADGIDVTVIIEEYSVSYKKKDPERGWFKRWRFWVK